MQSKILGSNFTEDDSMSSEMPTLAPCYKLPYKAPGAFLFFMRHMQSLLALCFISLTVVQHVSAINVASENAAAGDCCKNVACDCYTSVVLLLSRGFNMGPF